MSSAIGRIYENHTQFPFGWNDLAHRIFNPCWTAGKHVQRPGGSLVMKVVNARLLVEKPGRPFSVPKYKMIPRSSETGSETVFG